MILIVGLYLDAAPERLGEFIECLIRNAGNQSISQIQVMLETPCDVPNLIASFPVLASPKITLHLHGRRLTYSDLFSFANEHFVDSSADDRADAHVPRRYRARAI